VELRVEVLDVLVVVGREVDVACVLVGLVYGFSLE